MANNNKRKLKRGEDGERLVASILDADKSFHCLINNLLKLKTTLEILLEEKMILIGKSLSLSKAELRPKHSIIL